MKEYFRYLFSLLKAYPKVTLVFGIFFVLIIGLSMKDMEEINLLKTTGTILAQILSIVNLKVWLVAFIRDKIMFNPKAKLFGFLFLYSLISVFLAIILSGAFIW